MTSAPRLIIGGDLLLYYKMQHNVPKHLSKCSFIYASLTYLFIFPHQTYVPDDLVWPNDTPTYDVTTDDVTKMMVFARKVKL